MVDFAALKSNRGSSLQKLSEELTKLNKPQNDSKEDGRFWKPTVEPVTKDASGKEVGGNGFAIIRFLPAHPDETIPFIRIWEHGFKGPGGWYIEKSLTTLGDGTPDPCSEYNSKLWATGVEANQAIVRKQKRKLSYYSNILVVSDPAKPENEGKVFIYSYGKKIFDKLNDLMHPQFPGDTPVNPYDMWDGANFKLKIRQVEGYRNYDKSEFESPSPIAPTDEQIENIWKKIMPLQQFLDPKEFKTYDQLKERLVKVLQLPSGTPEQRREVETQREEAPTQRAAEGVSSPKKETPPWLEDGEEETDSLDFFKKLKDK